MRFFQFHSAQLTDKCICKLSSSLQIFTHVTGQNSPPGCYHHPFDRGERLTRPRQDFLKTYSPVETGEGRNYSDIKNAEIVYFKDAAHASLRCRSSQGISVRFLQGNRKEVYLK